MFLYKKDALLTITYHSSMLMSCSCHGHKTEIEYFVAVFKVYIFQGQPEMNVPGH